LLWPIFVIFFKDQTLVQAFSHIENCLRKIAQEIFHRGMSYKQKQIFISCEQNCMGKFTRLAKVKAKILKVNFFPQKMALI